MTFWNEKPDDFFDLPNESRQFYLHPWLRKHIVQFCPKRILDYGSADGALLLKNGIRYDELCLYDPSEKMLSFAPKFIESNKSVRTLTSSSEINANYFDLVICSLVLLTISNAAELDSTCSTIYSSIRAGGRCVIADTHPCFRQYHFSTWSTSLDNSPFYYLNNGLPFTTMLSDATRTKHVQFIDYHWSISYLINMFISKGLHLSQMYELPDEAAHEKFSNKLYPCYLVLDFDKPKN